MKFKTFLNNFNFNFKVIFTYEFQKEQRLSINRTQIQILEYIFRFRKFEVNAEIGFGDKSVTYTYVNVF